MRLQSCSTVGCALVSKQNQSLVHIRLAELKHLQPTISFEIDF